MSFVKLIKSILPLKVKQKLRPLALSNEYLKPFVTPSPIDHIVVANQEHENRYSFDLKEIRNLSPVDDNVFSENNFVLVLGSKYFLNIFSKYVGELVSPKEIKSIFENVKEVLAAKNNETSDALESALNPLEHIKSYLPKHNSIYLGNFFALEQIRTFLFHLSEDIATNIPEGNKIKVCLVFDQTSFLKSDELTFGIDDVLDILEINNQIDISVHEITESVKPTKKKHSGKLNITTHKIQEIDLFSNRFSNPSYAARRSYKSLLQNDAKTVAVLDWLKLIKTHGYQSVLTSLAKRNPDVSFVIMDAIWDMPINNSTTNFADYQNIKFSDNLSPEFLHQFSAVFDEVFIFDLEAFLGYPFGRFVLTCLLAQGIKISTGKTLTDMPVGLNPDLKNNLALTGRIVDFSPDEVESLDAIEARIGAAYKHIATAPKSIWEILFSGDSKFAKPVAWKNGLCLITLHRLAYLENITGTLNIANSLGMAINLVAHDLSKEDQEYLDRYFLKEFPKLKIQYENKFALGKGISDAIVNSKSDFWTKVDDDDTYLPYYWYEIYASLRTSLESYIGKRARVYHFVNSKKFYAQKRMGQFGVTMSSKGHVSGATLSGATEQVRRLPFPAFSRYNMDVAIGAKYHEAGVNRHIGSPFFLRVNRYENNMHTWFVDQSELVDTSVEITENIHSNTFVYEGNTAIENQKQSKKFAYIHRVMPGTIGYGFGTWMPEKIAETGSHVDEFLMYTQDFTIEKIATFKAERISHSLNMVSFNAETFADFCKAKLANKYYQISLINMPEIGQKASIIRQVCGDVKIAVDIRTPYLGKVLRRKEDMLAALEVADKIFAPGLEVIETWMPSGQVSAEIANKLSEIPVCINLHEGYKRAKSKQVKKPVAKAPIKLFYNGSVNEKREMSRVIEIARNSLREKKCTITFCCTQMEFCTYNPSIDDLTGLKFIGVKSSDEMPFVMAQYDCLLSWIPPNSVYEAAWSTKAIEAAALGIPVIATKTLGHDLMIEKGFGLELFDETAVSFELALKNARKQNKTALDKSFKAATKFDWGNFVENYID